MDQPLPDPRRRATWRLVVLTLLFVLSGATALAYEVIWFRRFADLWGATAPATAAVVAAFLFGLGLGARAFGPLADRTRAPLKLYAAFELAIGLLALLVPFELELVGEWTAGLAASLSDRPLLLAATRFSLAALVIGPPTVLMGATLPLLVRPFAESRGSTADAAAWLLFANGLGAALGAWVTGFVLLPALGLGLTGGLAVAANVLVALVAWAVLSEIGSLRTPEPPPEDDGREESPRALGAVALAMGAASLALQMVWVRQMGLVVGGTTYAFTAVLAVFVLGLAFGALLFRLGGAERRPLSTLGLAAAGLGLSAAAGWFAVPALGELVGGLAPQRADSVRNAALCLGVALALEGLPTLFLGLALPALVALARRDLRAAGRTVGRLYAWNTLGAIAGATITTAGLLPVLGAHGVLLAAVATYTLGFAALAGGRLRRPGHAAALVASLVAVAALALRAPDEREQIRRNIGAYLYGPSAFDLIGERAELLFLREAPTANVVVLGVEGGPDNPIERAVTLRVNGKVDGSDIQDASTQLGSAYFPRLLRPDARSVLVIGFGTGATAGASALFEGTAVDCCELEPAILETSPFFHHMNHRPELNPRVRLVAEDGRSWVSGAEHVYDLIVSEPSNPWMAGVSRLYTREFYETVRARLAPGGLLAQWLQTYSIGREEFALVANTMQSVFPHTALVRIVGGDTLILGSFAPIVPDRGGIDRAQALVDRTLAAKSDLETRFGTSDVRSLLLMHIALDSRGLERLVLEVGQAEVNTDDNARLEFDAPRVLFGGAQAGRRMEESLVFAADAGMLGTLIADWGWTEPQELALRALRDHYFRAEHPSMAVDVSTLGSAYSEAPTFLADRLIWTPSTDLEELRAGVRRLLVADRSEALRVALVLGQRGDALRSAAAYETLREAHPDSATVCASLALVYAQLGRRAEAEAQLARALELDPLNEAVLGVQRELEAGPGGAGTAAQSSRK